MSLRISLFISKYLLFTLLCTIYHFNEILATTNTELRITRIYNSHHPVITCCSATSGVHCRTALQKLVATGVLFIRVSASLVCIETFQWISLYGQNFNYHRHSEGLQIALEIKSYNTLAITEFSSYHFHFSFFVMYNVFHLMIFLKSCKIKQKTLCVKSLGIKHRNSFIFLSKSHRKLSFSCKQDFFL